MTKNSVKTVEPSKKRIFTHSDLIKTLPITSTGEILFRPAIASDIPLWKEFIEQCSKDSLYARFRTTSSVIKDQGEVYCHSDYENTITIGVFITSDGKEKLIGAAWLFRDGETNQVELALLIADNWQHKGIGTKLSEFCRTIILKWGVNGVMGTTTLDNFEIKQMLNKNNIAFNNSFGGNSLEFNLSLDEITSL